MPKLTARQDVFVREYLTDLNATQAAIRAGYSAKNADKIGPELLGKTRVAEAIQAARVARAERTELSQDWVIAKLRENVDRSMQAVPVTDKDGPTGEWKYEGAVANRALELLGKHIGMFKDKVELSGAVAVTFETVYESPPE